VVAGHSGQFTPGGYLSTLSTPLDKIQMHYASVYIMHFTHAIRRSDFEQILGAGQIDGLNATVYPPIQVYFGR